MRKLLLICSAWLIPAILIAQAPIVISTVPFTINTGTSFNTTGNVTLQGTVSIQNSGSFSLSGNWINNAATGAINSSLPGTVALNGGAQTIGGIFATRFSNLSFTNPVVSFKTLLRPIFISSIGSLGSGFSTLVLNGLQLTLENSSTNAFNGFGNIRHENTALSGGVTWFATTSNLYTLPYSNNAGNTFRFQFRPVIADTVIVGTYATNAANLPFPVLPYNVTHVRNTGGVDNSDNMVDRYWKLEARGSSLQAIFGYAVSEVAANGNGNVRAQKWNTPLDAWEPILPGQSNPTAQQVNVPILPATPAGGFIWALTLLSSPLPIELLDFTAAVTGSNEVTCYWVTETEVNNDFFTVEKSNDGNAFEPVSMMEGAGNSTNRLFYQAKDKNPYSGKSYYRIKQTDFDGRSTYSQTVSVVFKQDGSFAMTLFPNPSIGNLNIILPSEETISALRVTGSDGRLVFESTDSEALKGGSVFTHDFSNLSEGVYFVSILTGIDLLTGKLILKK